MSIPMMRRRLLMAMGMEDDDMANFELIKTIDFSDEAYQVQSFSIELNNISEIYIEIENCKNDSTLDSGYSVELTGELGQGENNVQILKNGKSTYNSCSNVLLFEKGGMWFAISSTPQNSTVNGFQTPYWLRNPIKNVGKVNKITFKTPSTNYINKSGTWKIYAR